MNKNECWLGVVPWFATLATLEDCPNLILKVSLEDRSIKLCKVDATPEAYEVELSPINALLEISLSSEVLAKLNNKYPLAEKTTLV
jgi:hypothetical protein